MTPPRRLLRAKPNRLKDRVTDAWAAFAIRVQTPGPTSQIQTLLATRQGQAGVPNGTGRSERLDGKSFEPTQGH
jgi:hypothetical protein